MDMKVLSLSVRTAHRAAGRPGRRPSPLHPNARAHANRGSGTASLPSSAAAAARPALSLGRNISISM
eukprot:6478809-Prymnesium_polylepis.1